MNKLAKLSVAFLLLAFSAQALAQSDDNEELKIAALEALISAPPERAMPLAARVLEGDHSDEVKERALFILSQIDHPDAHEILMSTATGASGELRAEAIRMIGIGGNPDALASLSSLYSSVGPASVSAPCNSPVSVRTGTAMAKAWRVNSDSLRSNPRSRIGARSR